MLRFANIFLIFLSTLQAFHFAQANPFYIDYNYGSKKMNFKKKFYAHSLEAVLRLCFNENQTHNTECVRQVNFAGIYPIFRVPGPYSEGNICVTTSKKSGSTFYGKSPQEVIRSCKSHAAFNDVECEQNLNLGCRACAFIQTASGTRNYIFAQSRDVISTSCHEMNLLGYDNEFCRELTRASFQEPCNL